ncbi:UNVERIFIED_CONTAM: hypothetical protein GTU68_043674 [Idotea baltica]|nr:hypothetical protein [Idotea baltica]
MCVSSSKRRRDRENRRRFPKCCLIQENATEKSMCCNPGVWQRECWRGESLRNAMGAAAMKLGIRFVLKMWSRAIPEFAMSPKEFCYGVYWKIPT